MCGLGPCSLGRYTLYQHFEAVIWCYNIDLCFGSLQSIWPYCSTSHSLFITQGFQIKYMLQTELSFCFFPSLSDNWERGGCRRKQQLGQHVCTQRWHALKEMELIISLHPHPYTFLKKYDISNTVFWIPALEILLLIVYITSVVLHFC